MRSAILLTLFALGIGGTAVAQGTILPLDGQRPRPAQPARVHVQMHITGGTSAASAEEQQNAQETMRRAIYQMSAKECAAMTEAFKTECRLISLNVNNSARGGSRNQNEPVVSGTAVYELGKAAE